MLLRYKEGTFSNWMFLMRIYSSPSKIARLFFPRRVSMYEGQLVLFAAFCRFCILPCWKGEQLELCGIGLLSSGCCKSVEYGSWEGWGHSKHLVDAAEEMPSWCWMAQEAGGRHLAFRSLNAGGKRGF